MLATLVRAGLIEQFHSKQQINLPVFKENLFQHFKDRGALVIYGKPKLRTYCEVKQIYGPENYVLFNLPKKKRSLCAQIRAGILGLHLETGRFMGMEEEDRICHLCDLQEIENEIHFILYCPFYHSIRQNLFHNVVINNEIISFEDPGRLQCVLNCPEWTT